MKVGGRRHRGRRCKQGMNRFTWDMRYPDARDFPGLIMWAGSTRGPLAPPGKYQVRADRKRRHEDGGLSHHAQRSGQRPSPMPISSSSSSWRSQINDRVSAANEAVLRIRNVKDQITDRGGKTTDAAIKRRPPKRWPTS